MEPLVELFGTSACPYTTELRQQLEWQGATFVEYDVDQDLAARARLLVLTDGRPEVPILVRDGRVAGIGWNGRSCLIAVSRASGD